MAKIYTSTRRAPLLCLSLLLASTLGLTPGASAQKVSSARLEQAIANLKGIRQDLLTDAQREAKLKQIEDAWAVIRSAGKSGTERLKMEVRRVDASNEKDDFFKLNASAFLWSFGGLDEAETVAGIWHSTPLDAQYNYVFYSAIEAAQTGDLRALPMLEAVLSDDKGTVYLHLHAMTLRWPMTHEFLWGTFGPKGLKRLTEILNTSKNSVELQSATIRLAEAQYLDALPRIRELARDERAEVRAYAIRALGVFGHPQDYEFLLAGLDSRNPGEVFSFAYALYEYDDLRAVPRLIPLLKSRDEAVRREVFAALTHLLTSEAFDAIFKYSGAAPSAKERSEAMEYLENELREYNLSLVKYLEMTPAQKASAIADIRRKREAGRYELNRGERGFTRAQLLAAAVEWKKSHRLRSSNFPLGTIETRHILSGATVEEIPLLLEVKAAMYPRLSDEVLYETRRIDMAVKFLGRSRYRKVPGITERVEARD